MDSRGKSKGVWIQGEREKVNGSKGKEKRKVDPRGKGKGVWIQGERKNVSGSNGKENWNIDPNVNLLKKDKGSLRYKEFGFKRGK